MVGYRSDFLVFAAAACSIAWMIRNHIREQRQDKRDADLADQRYATKVRLRAQLQQRLGAEAVYRETGIILLVTLKSVEYDGREVAIALAGSPEYCATLSIPPSLLSSLTVGASLDCFGVGEERWSSMQWILFFDANSIRNFKAASVTLPEEPRSERFHALSKCLSW
jgi:hypothetical protein